MQHFPDGPETVTIVTVSTMDHDSLEALRKNHPAWRLMLADNAPMILPFLFRVFVVANERSIPSSQLISLLDDELYALRQSLGDLAYPRTAQDYLDEWAEDRKGWLRKYYPRDSEEAAYDLAPAVEKVIGWIQGLQNRSFVGTESRLRLIFDLLKEIVDGSQEDPAEQLKELERQRTVLDEKIRRVKRGELDLLDDTARRERFDHMSRTARDLLADFREVEQNFRMLDRSTRERIAAWDGSRAGLLEKILHERASIEDSDQGKSFQAFWDFLMSSERQTELESLLARCLELPAIQATAPDRSLRRIHHEWLEAGEHTQRSVAMLSRELRRFLDDQAWLENRRIMEILLDIENHALALRDNPVPGGFYMELDLPHMEINLPLERPLYSPPLQSVIQSGPIMDAVENFEADALYNLVLVDDTELRQNIRSALRNRDQIDLVDIVEQYPLEHGLAELVAYLNIAGKSKGSVLDDETPALVTWLSTDGSRRQARIPRVLFTREALHEP